MDKTVNTTDIRQGVGKLLAGSSHTLPCCSSKPRSRVEAGKKQAKRSLEYGYSMGCLFVYLQTKSVVTHKNLRLKAIIPIISLQDGWIVYN